MGLKPLAFVSHGLVLGQSRKRQCNIFSRFVYFYLEVLQ
jgi:hypothetical protein